MTTPDPITRAQTAWDRFNYLRQLRDMEGFGELDAAITSLTASPVLGIDGTGLRDAIRLAVAEDDSNKYPINLIPVEPQPSTGPEWIMEMTDEAIDRCADIAVQVASATARAALSATDTLSLDDAVKMLDSRGWKECTWIVDHAGGEYTLSWALGEPFDQNKQQQTYTAFEAIAIAAALAQQSQATE